MRRWSMITLGALCVLPLVAIDPAAMVLLFDVELLAALGAAGLMMTRGDARVLWLRFLDCPDVLTWRAGWRLTRESPASLLQA